MQTTFMELTHGRLSTLTLTVRPKGTGIRSHSSTGTWNGQIQQPTQNFIVPSSSLSSDFTRVGSQQLGSPTPSLTDSFRITRHAFISSSVTPSIFHLNSAHVTQSRSQITPTALPNDVTTPRHALDEIDKTSFQGTISLTIAASFSKPSVTTNAAKVPTRGTISDTSRSDFSSNITGAMSTRGLSVNDVTSLERNKNSSLETRRDTSLDRPVKTSFHENTSSTTTLAVGASSGETSVETKVLAPERKGDTGKTGFSGGITGSMSTSGLSVETAVASGVVATSVLSRQKAASVFSENLYSVKGWPLRSVFSAETSGPSTWRQTSSSLHLL